MRRCARDAGRLRACGGPIQPINNQREGDSHRGYGRFLSACSKNADDAKSSYLLTLPVILCMASALRCSFVQVGKVQPPGSLCTLLIITAERRSPWINQSQLRETPWKQVRSSSRNTSWSDGELGLFVIHPHEPGTQPGDSGYGMVIQPHPSTTRTGPSLFSLFFFSWPRIRLCLTAGSGGHLGKTCGSPEGFDATQQST
jgi:hypothetical protein